MSGGSGSGVYDPVTTTDNVQFSEGGERYGQFRIKGGRTYSFGTYRKSGIKAVCDEIRNRSRPKCLLAVFVTTLVLILMLLAIAIAASHKAPEPVSGYYEAWENKTTGLMFFPWGLDDDAGRTVHIHFSVEKPEEINNIKKIMDNVTTAYQILRQQDSSIFVDCNASYAPPDKVCKLALSAFGNQCTSVYSYGYRHNTPCVLLMLRLPKDWTIRPYEPKDGPVYIKAENMLGDRVSPEYVGISCEAASPEDAKNIHNSTLDGDPIEYHPPKGFPSYVYRKRTVEQFLTPAVMVHFKTVRDFRPTRINCKAWGQVVDSLGNNVNQEDFSTSFVLHID